MYRTFNLTTDTTGVAVNAPEYMSDDHAYGVLTVYTDGDRTVSVFSSEDEACHVAAVRYGRDDVQGAEVVALDW